MVGLGLVDLILFSLFLLAIILAKRVRAAWLSVLIAVALVAVLSERLAPGTLAGIGNDIQEIDRVNLQGPHIDLAIPPSIRFER